LTQTEAAVALILAPGPRGEEALFIRRALRAGDPWSGHIGLPGGRRESGDADLLAAAVRETREEVGVDLPPAALLRALDDVRPAVPPPTPLLIRPFAFRLSARPETTLSDEVSAVIWAPLADLRTAEGMTRLRLHDQEREVPCFRHGDAVIWGLTYRILANWLQSQ
jgi:8-oxo-dGTP pyrophosphatase MutT (NUDIX family)